MSTWLGRGENSGSARRRSHATLQNALTDAATDAHHPHGTLLHEITRDLHARLSDVTHSFDADEVKEVAVKLVVALESFRPKTNVNPGWPATTLPAGRAASVTVSRNVRSLTRVAPLPTPRRLSNFHQTMVRNEVQPSTIFRGRCFPLITLYPLSPQDVRMACLVERNDAASVKVQSTLLRPARLLLAHRLIYHFLLVAPSRTRFMQTRERSRETSRKHRGTSGASSVAVDRGLWSLVFSAPTDDGTGGDTTVCCRRTLPSCVTHSPPSTPNCPHIHPPR